MNITNGSDRRSISFTEDENIIGGNAFEDEEGDKNESHSLLLKEAGDNNSNMTTSSYGTATATTATNRPQIHRRRTISATIINSTQSNYKVTSLDFEHV